MRSLTLPLLLLLISLQPLFGQEIGVPVPVEIAETSTRLTLDFSTNDYVLVLYSTNPRLETGGFGLERPYGFSVTADFGASNSTVGRGPGLSPAAAVPDRVSLENTLREIERKLSVRLQQSGGYRPHAAKVVAQQIGSTREFVFPSFGNVSKTTITASLVATSDRASAYVDVADVDRLNKASIQAQIDRFSSRTFPVVTSMFGSESDVDEDGKIHLLYTNLVEKVGGFLGGGPSGFFSSPSLLPLDQGGDGNLSDLLYINPDMDPDKFNAVAAHEFQHLINFNHHVLIRGGISEDVWLNEGLSAVSEDLIGENDAHNTRFVDYFLRYTPNKPIGAQSKSQGIRGSEYLFVRSLIEEFGTGILARLVQTDKMGIPNIESATNDRFVDIYDRYVSRLFLSGLGLNSTLNYTTAPLADSISHVRAFPLPTTSLIWPEGGYKAELGGGLTAVPPDSSLAVTVNGKVYAFSAAYVRLIGNGKQAAITIQTNPNGQFRAKLIPIPVNYQTGIAIPEAYRPRVSFDTPPPIHITTGEAIHVSGTVSDTSMSGPIEFIFRSSLREIGFHGPITHGKFDGTLFFYPDEVGIYTHSIFVTPEPNEVRIGVMRYNSIVVVQGKAPSPDFDRDGTVGFPDFIVFASAFGKSWADEDFKPWFDLDLDGEVGFSDFLIFAQAFGTDGP